MFFPLAWFSQYTRQIKEVNNENAHKFDYRDSRDLYAGFLYEYGNFDKRLRKLWIL